MSHMDCCVMPRSRLNRRRRNGIKTKFAASNFKDFKSNCSMFRILTYSWLCFNMLECSKTPRHTRNNHQGTDANVCFCSRSKYNISDIDPTWTWHPVSAVFSRAVLHDGHDCRQLYSSSVTAKIQQDQTMYYMPKCKKKKRKRKTRKEVFLGLNCL